MSTATSFEFAVRLFSVFAFVYAGLVACAGLSGLYRGRGGKS